MLSMSAYVDCFQIAQSLFILLVCDYILMPLRVEVTGGLLCHLCHCLVQDLLQLVCSDGAGLNVDGIEKWWRLCRMQAELATF